MIPRVLEPEVMDTAEEAGDYDSMDHSTVNQRFVDDWIAECRERHWGPDDPSQRGRTVRMLDVGTGTAQIPIEFCRRQPHLLIVAVDLAEEMLRVGTKNVERAGLSSRILLQKIDAKSSPFTDHEFEAIVSNSIIHHIPNPVDCFREMLRILQPGGLIMVRDLLRPRTTSDVESLVATYADGASLRQQQLFRQSLHAALTVEEVEDLLDKLGLPADWVRATSDRHWTMTGVLPH